MTTTSNSFEAACYGHTGDRLDSFEINPQVVDVARKYFIFLSRTEADVKIHADDGRLGLAREPAHTFNTIVLDALPGDVIPVHLLTPKAFDLYFKLLRHNGVLAIHVSNSYVALRPVVRQFAAVSGKHVTVWKARKHRSSALQIKNYNKAGRLDSGVG